MASGFGASRRWLAGAAPGACRSMIRSEAPSWSMTVCSAGSLPGGMTVGGTTPEKPVATALPSRSSPEGCATARCSAMGMQTRRRRRRRLTPQCRNAGARNAAPGHFARREIRLDVMSPAPLVATQIRNRAPSSDGADFILARRTTTCRRRQVYYTGSGRSCLRAAFRSPKNPFRSDGLRRDRFRHPEGVTRKPYQFLHVEGQSTFVSVVSGPASCSNAANSLANAGASKATNYI